MLEMYPVLLDGEEKGKLTVSREGLLTCFSARCEDPGRLLRLSVYGAGQEGYLGVMSPEKGVLTLRRKLSRLELKGFPAEIGYAGESGKAPEPPAPPEPGEEPEAAEPAPEPGAPEESGLVWTRFPDGSLYTTWKGRPYRAVPLAGHGLPLGWMVEKRRIEGTDYAVFAAQGRRR